MNAKIKAHLVNYSMENFPENGEPGDSDLWETLTECGTKVYDEKIDSRRWWDDYFTVYELNGMLIGCHTAQTTGDDSPWDKGWEFDLGTLCEVTKTETVKTVITYSPIKG